MAKTSKKEKSKTGDVEQKTKPITQEKRNVRTVIKRDDVNGEYYEVEQTQPAALATQSKEVESNE